MTNFETIRGMRDFLPADLARRRFVEAKVRECFKLYGYDEVETPILESFELIAAKAGDEIRHRMYMFDDLRGRKIAMRPEMTASIARLVASKFRSEAKPLRLGYIANCFRYDNPQRGRFREFWQAGFELFGSERTEADAEVIILFHDLMRRLGFHDFTLKLGSVGILRGVLAGEGVNEANQNIFMGFLDKQKMEQATLFLDELQVSEHCKGILHHLIALKGTDWAHMLTEGRHLVEDYEKAFSALTKLAEIVRLAQAGGVTSTILVDLGFARGLEYYTGLVFEVFTPGLGIALGGGGRYDRLVELFGGEPTPAVGFSPGIDRIVLAMQQAHLFAGSEVVPPRVLIIPVGEQSKEKVLKVAADLRTHGISTQIEISGRSITPALAFADKKGYPFILILGARELEKGSIIVRDMHKKTQKEVPISSLIDELQQTL